TRLLFQRHTERRLRYAETVHLIDEVFHCSCFRHMEGEAEVHGRAREYIHISGRYIRKAAIIWLERGFVIIGQGRLRRANQMRELRLVCPILQPDDYGNDLLTGRSRNGVTSRELALILLATDDLDNFEPKGSVEQVVADLPSHPLHLVGSAGFHQRISVG